MARASERFRSVDPEYCDVRGDVLISSSLHCYLCALACALSVSLNFFLSLFSSPFFLRSGAFSFLCFFLDLFFLLAFVFWFPTAASTGTRVKGVPKRPASSSIAPKGRVSHFMYFVLEYFLA